MSKNGNKFKLLCRYLKLGLVGLVDKQLLFFFGLRVRVPNATFNNISVISWQSVLLVEKTREPGENHWPVASHRQTLSHNIVSTTLVMNEIPTRNFSDDRHWLIAQIQIVVVNLTTIRSRPRRPPLLLYINSHLPYTLF